jgi:ubiquinone/menaquinone biosynthesis C-methylase UbiE
MELEDIKKHWENWASEFGTSLRATTKAYTGKMIEIDTIRRAINSIMVDRGEKLKILEVGCGNGKNCLELAKFFPEVIFTGIDFVENMISSAIKSRNEMNIGENRIKFTVGNVLELDLPPESFDLIFTNRCLINLNTDLLQQEAINKLRSLLREGAYLLLLENSKQTYDFQNEVRQAVGLIERTPAKFNHFLDETTLLPFLKKIGLDCVDVEDFISLHDIVLYILLPMVNGGKVDYDNPLVDAAAKLNIAISSFGTNLLGKFGQNRMYKCKKIKS